MKAAAGDDDSIINSNRAAKNNIVREGNGLWTRHVLTKNLILNAGDWWIRKDAGDLAKASTRC